MRCEDRLGRAGCTPRLPSRCSGCPVTPLAPGGPPPELVWATLAAAGSWCGTSRPPPSGSAGQPQTPPGTWRLPLGPGQQDPQCCEAQTRSCPSSQKPRPQMKRSEGGPPGGNTPPHPAAQPRFPAGHVAAPVTARGPPTPPRGRALTSSHLRLPLGQVFRKHPAGRMLRGVELGEVGWRLGGRGSAGAPAGGWRLPPAQLLTSFSVQGEGGSAGGREEEEEEEGGPR